MTGDTILNNPDIAHSITTERTPPPLGDCQPHPQPLKTPNPAAYLCGSTYSGRFPSVESHRLSVSASLTECAVFRVPLHGSKVPVQAAVWRGWWKRGLEVLLGTSCRLGWWAWGGQDSPRMTLHGARPLHTTFRFQSHSQETDLGAQ